MTAPEAVTPAGVVLFGTPIARSAKPSPLKSPLATPLLLLWWTFLNRWKLFSAWPSPHLTMAPHLLNRGDHSIDRAHSNRSQLPGALALSTGSGRLHCR